MRSPHRIRNAIAIVTCVLTLAPLLRLLLAWIFPIVGYVEQLALWSLVGCIVGLVGAVTLPFYFSRRFGLLAIPALIDGGFFVMIAAMSTMH